MDGDEWFSAGCFYASHSFFSYQDESVVTARGVAAGVDCVDHSMGDLRYKIFEDAS